MVEFSNDTKEEVTEFPNNMETMETARQGSIYYYMNNLVEPLNYHHHEYLVAQGPKEEATKQGTYSVT